MSNDGYMIYTYIREMRLHIGTVHTGVEEGMSMLMRCIQHKSSGLFRYFQVVSFLAEVCRVLEALFGAATSNLQVQLNSSTS
jgi:hypothetical protein